MTKRIEASTRRPCVIGAIHRDSRYMRLTPSRMMRWIVLCVGLLLLFLNETCLGSTDTIDNEEEPADDTAAGSEDSVERDPTSMDHAEDSMFDPLQADPDCVTEEECWAPPVSTLSETTTTIINDIISGQGNQEACETGADSENGETETCQANETKTTDQHWGSDPNILRMRDRLRHTGSGLSLENRRPPIFLMPGLASTRLVAWRTKVCKQNPFMSNIRVQDYVWLNINLLVHSSIDVTCMQECLQLGDNQTDMNDLETGCKLRPDEGLDAIASLSPTHLGSQLLVGGTNTVYAWLIQWLADHLGYDVSNIVGLPYDWRLSPDKMQARDGFLTLTRRRLEAAVQSNGAPGIVVAHSMGNTIFRYFLEWLKSELQQEAYQRMVQQQAQQQQRRRTLLEQQGSANSHVKNASVPGWVAGLDMDEARAATATAEGQANKNSTAPLPNGTAPNQHTKPPTDTLHAELWQLALVEGETNWQTWIDTHIWTYVGLSAPLLGAVNPLKAVISGENMGLPFTDEQARTMELTFGSTHTIGPVSSKEGFCDDWTLGEEEGASSSSWEEEPDPNAGLKRAASRLACLDDIGTEIEWSQPSAKPDDESKSSKQEGPEDPWQHFPALKRLLRDRADWDTEAPLIRVIEETCHPKEKSPCANSSSLHLGPRDSGTGQIFAEFNRLWKEEDEPLHNKRDQLRESFWDTPVSNILNQTWDRPLIKHVIMGYGVDTPTEVGYIYRKRHTVDQPTASNTATPPAYDGVPDLQTVIWETAGGIREEQRVDVAVGGIASFLKKKPKRVPTGQGKLLHSGDGSVPYLSLAWAQTWLLNALRARRFAGDANEDGRNPLDEIEISHRPKGAMEWKEGSAPEDHVGGGAQQDTDTGTNHPHGTKYKPEMLRYHVRDTHPSTGLETTTTVLEAIGVEHKETTRNYDILAAVFTDVLKFMHDDLDIV